MVAIGPMPGRTPISVPIRAPASAKPRLAGVSATLKPVARLLRNSISLPVRPDRDRQAEADDEDRPGQHDEAYRRGERLPQFDATRRQRTDADQKQDRDHKAELLYGKREGDKAGRDHHNRDEPQ